MSWWLRSAAGVLRQRVSVTPPPLPDAAYAVLNAAATSDIAVSTFTLGSEFEVTAPITVTALRRWFPTGAVHDVTVKLYEQQPDTSWSEVRSALVTCTPNEWNEQPVTSYELSTGTRYVISAYSVGERQNILTAEARIDERVVCVTGRFTSTDAFPASTTESHFWGAYDFKIAESRASWEYSVFTAGGTWDWAAAGQPSSVDVLLVAGGGGGHHARSGNTLPGGGGGAGGVRAFFSESVAGNVAVTVGHGGAGGVGSSNTMPNNGGDSEFGALSVTGGGRGGRTSAGDFDPGVGGSGGGNYAVGAGADGIANEGSAGGGGIASPAFSAGGGGGKTAAGAAAPSAGGGAGGRGVRLIEVNFSPALSNGAPESVGGGGGGGCYTNSTTSRTGGAGGLGGGGAGGSITSSSSDREPGVSGVANTGGGGGAASMNSSGTNVPDGGAGGTGLVIVRWIKP